MPKRVYLTTTLPYVNAAPHIGFALEIVQADIVARHNRLIGNGVFFNTGTDEHGQKIFEAAKREGKDPQTYVNEYAEKFGLLREKLDLSYDNFIRTTDSNHVAAAEEFWRRCEQNGDIYKKLYKVKYCVGCELEKTDSELENGRCPLHPNQELEIREEENHFFRFSKYQKGLLDLYEEHADLVIPGYRFNEIKAFVSRGLEDFSISRLKEKMPWGVPVPNDPNHVMYVWFDALVNYLAAVGWPDEKYKDWWPCIQFAGKDNLRQQSAMWQAMLMSAGIEPSKQIVIHGFITSGGQKMSKSLGNVIDPLEIVEGYGTDALRYYLARHMHPFEDSDFTKERFHEAYTANLVNGLGNLTSRIMKLSEDHLQSGVPMMGGKVKLNGYLSEKLNAFQINEAMDYIFRLIGACDQKMTERQPFKKIKMEEEYWKQEARKEISDLVHDLLVIAVHLEPFMPGTSKKIREAILSNKKPDALFPRKD